MAHEIIPHDLLKNLLESVKATQDVDVLKEAVEWITQQLIEADATEQIGAGRYERNDQRKTYRNGSRPRQFSTRLGNLDLEIPKLRNGSYYPDWLLERQKPAEQAIISVVMEAYVTGVSTRKVDRLVKELGLDGMDKSAVSRINKGLDIRVNSFLQRPLQARYSYLWLDATYTKVREDGRVQSVALVVAMGVRDDGYREILGFNVGSAETEAFWLEFLRKLRERGLEEVRLIISDAHKGLYKAIQAVFGGASWQRCYVHFMRDIMSHLPKSAVDAVLEKIKTIFTQPSYEYAKQQLQRVVADLRQRYPKVADLLEEASEDLLAHMHFPKSHWQRLRSTNPLERLMREIKRRINVVGIFPNREATIRLTGAILMEQNDEWITGKRYFSEESMRRLDIMNTNSLKLEHVA